MAASRCDLLDLDTTKKRNRPKVPLTKCKHASSFLPTVARLDFQFDLSAQNSSETGDASDSKEIKFNLIFPTNCINHITSFEPSAIDFEIKSIDPNASGNDTVML